VERIIVRDIDIYTALPYNPGMEFIEATAFTRHVYSYLTDDEYMGLQSFLLKYPEAGKVVPGAGGVRKLRWGMAGRGKSGGVRIIYFFKKRDDEIWLLTIYSKSETENIPAYILRQIAEEIKNV
jgi:mRNA-degrading endonuclease RelE of RelBE toxin-antitoxin system